MLFRHVSVYLFLFSLMTDYRRAFSGGKMYSEWFLQAAIPYITATKKRGVVVDIYILSVAFIGQEAVPSVDLVFCERNTQRQPFSSNCLNWNPTCTRVWSDCTSFAPLRRIRRPFSSTSCLYPHASFLHFTNASVQCLVTQAEAARRRRVYMNCPFI